MISFRNRYYAHVHTVTTHTKFIINYILHRMSLLKLTEIDSGIAKTKIGKIIFLRCFNISFSFNVISLC